MSKKIEELRSKVEEMETRAAEMQKQAEERAAAMKAEEERKNAFYKGTFKMNENKKEERNISQKFMELRSGEEGLKLNDTGKDYYGDLVELFRIDKPLTQRASFIRGSYTGFKIPVMTARPAVQAYGLDIKETVKAGRTDLSVDDQMAISPKTITPELFYSILGITYSTEKFSMVTDGEIENAFAEAFSEKIENDLQSRNAGSSYAISGLFSNDTSVCAAANAVEAAGASITWADLYKLADKVKGKSGKWTIIVPSELMGDLLANSTSDYNFCKEEYLRKGTIRGIEAVEVATSIDSLEAGDVYATVIDLNKNLKVCVAADDVILRTVYDKNSLNKYLQGAMGIAAEVVLPSEVWQLVKKA